MRIEAIGILLSLLLSASCTGAALGGNEAPPAAAPKAEPCPVNAQALVVLVFDQSCKAWCKEVKPILAELKEKYGERVQFCELDASENVLKDTEKTAKGLGVLSFLSGATNYVPMVGVFTAKHKLSKELVGPKKKEVYVDAIEKAMASK